MSMLPKEDTSFSWSNFWADLLKGAGRGLLVYDGSRAAQAALAGLDVFDAAQERRKQPGPLDQGDSPHEGALLKLRSVLSPEQWAALLRLPPGQQDAWAEEWAGVVNDNAPGADHAYPGNEGVQPPVNERLSLRPGRPISVNPLDGWRLQSILPFDADGRLNRPIYRR